MKKVMAVFAVVMGLTLSQGAFANSGKVDGKMADHKFKKMDTDGNGSVSRSEFDAAHEEMFKKGDKNGDGSLTQEEFRECMKEKMEKMREKREDIKDNMNDKKE